MEKVIYRAGCYSRSSSSYINKLIVTKETEKSIICGRKIYTTYRKNMDNHKVFDVFSDARDYAILLMKEKVKDLEDELKKSKAILKIVANIKEEDT